MSASVVAVASSPVITPVLTAAAGGAAAVLLPTAFGLGAALALQKMANDFEQARLDFENRQVVREQEFAGLRALHAARLCAADTFGRGIDASAVTSGMPDFLAGLVQECVLRARAVDQLSEATAAEALMDRAAGGDEEVLSLLEELHQKLDQAAISRASRTLRDEDWCSIVSIVERDMGSPLLQGPTNEALLASLEAELRALEALPPSERAVAIQGIEMLRSRIKRELKERTATLTRRQKEAEKFRQYAGEAIACFQAVASSDYLPEQAEKGKAGLKRLSDALARDTSQRQLEALAREARELYDSAIKTLQAERIAEEIGDVLKGMGYQLTSVENYEGKGCQIALGDDTGLNILVDTQGQIKTEMVAYTESASRPSIEAEDKVCDLVTGVFKALDSRDIKVRERTRKRRKAPGRIPVVARPQQAETGSASRQEARRMNVDGR